MIESHPFSDVFPLLSDTELKALAEDIRVNGLKESIWTFEDAILDGRNRHAACLLAEVEPKFRQFKGSRRSALALVVSANLKRRNLDLSQRAMVGVSLLPHYEQLAKERQGARTDIKETFPEGDAGQSRDAAGKAVGVSGKLIDAAAKVVDKGCKPRNS